MLHGNAVNNSITKRTLVIFVQARGAAPIVLGVIGSELRVEVLGGCHYLRSDFGGELHRHVAELTKPACMN